PDSVDPPFMASAEATRPTSRDGSSRAAWPPVVWVAVGLVLGIGGAVLVISPRSTRGAAAAVSAPAPPAVIVAGPGAKTNAPVVATAQPAQPAGGAGEVT